MFNNSEELLKFIKDEGVEMVDVRFCDLPGIMQHFTVPVSSFDQSVFDDGLGFDGSSIRGFQAINESDMQLYPDADDGLHRPVPRSRRRSTSTSSSTTRSRARRTPATRATSRRRRWPTSSSTGIADTAFFAPEAEFYIFDNVRYSTGVNEGYYHIDSVEGWWNSAQGGGEQQGLQDPPQGRLLPRRALRPLQPTCAPTWSRTSSSAASRSSGPTTRSAPPARPRSTTSFDTLLKAADDVMKFKYLIKNTAWEQGKSVTFMPKPIFGDNGSGMHVHQSLWKDGSPLFYDETGYGGLSDLARWYIGGILQHAPALLAFTNPTVNSYHRLVPGYEAPISLVYSSRNRSASVRIPITGTNPKAKRIETRFPDPSANPYLAFSALMLAGLDGIQNKTEPAAPIDKDIYELPPDEMAEIAQVPTSLGAVLDALEADHDFLTVGDVFTPDLIETWVDFKRDERDRAGPAAPAPARVRAVLRHLSRPLVVHADGPGFSNRGHRRPWSSGPSIRRPSTGSPIPKSIAPDRRAAAPDRPQCLGARGHGRFLVTRKTGHPISVRHAALSSVSRGPTR